jgi:hypothetical protein
MSPLGSRRNIVPGVLAPKRVSYRASVGISELRPRRLRAGRLDSFFIVGRDAVRPFRRAVLPFVGGQETAPRIRT